jgi:hypothetical protein
VKLERIAFLGRTFREYLDMFGLEEDEVAGLRVLDCPAGPSSFAAEAHARGLRVTACDVSYNMGAEKLEDIGLNDLEQVFEAFDKSDVEYVWDYYGSRDELIGLRKRALTLFAGDFEQGKGEGRYVEGALPSLPFGDREFDLALSGNFLFLYAEWLSIDTHLECLRELLRVSSEVRVFPVMTIEGMPYDYMGYILSTLADEGVKAELDPVDMELMKGGNKMLRLMHA